MKNPVRAQVMAHLTEFAAEAIKAGGDGYKAIKHRYPDTPDDVAWEADIDAHAAATEAWWQSVEKTIDGEIIKSALLVGETV